MAGIDYNILNQIKGVQIEPPENAMMRALQLRGLQEAAQLNALKMQEYQQDITEKNELAKIYANPNLKPGSQEFFNEIYRRAPRAADKLATAEVQRQTALSTQQTREEQRLAAEQKRKKDEEEYRFGVRNNRLIQIANAETPEEAYEMLQHYYGQGDLGYTDYRSLAPQLIENPNWEKTRTSLLTRTLSAEKQLTAPFDVRKAQAGASQEEQKLEAAKLDLETKQLDARRKQFDSVYPPNLIRSKEDVRNRILLQAQDPALKQLLTRFGTLEEIIARDVDEFGRDPLGYKQRLSGVPTAEILKAAEEKDRQEYSQYRFNEILNRRTPLTQEDYFKKKRGGVAAPVAAAADGAAPVAAADGATPVAAAENTAASAAPPLAAADATAAAAQAEKGPLVGTPVVKEATTYGVELLDPDAQAMYTAAAAEKDPVVKDVYLKLGDKILAESAARKRNKEYTGTFQNVDVALRELEQLKKEPSTPENATRIKVLEQLVATAQLGPPQAPPRPPAPTEITKKEEELEGLQRKLDAATDPNEKKNLRERIKRLKADISGDVYGRDRPPATTAVQDALISKAILDGRLDPGKVNSRNIVTIAKTLEMDPNANLKELSIDAMSGAAASKALAIQSAKILTAANEAKSMMKIVKTVSDKIDRTQYPTINAIQLAVDKGTGGKEIVQLNTAINALVNAYARAINPTGVSTVSDKTHAREVINSNYANGQLDAILDIMHQEMELAQKSPGEASTQLKEQRNKPKPAGTVDKNNKWLK
jgi:hypothetical protein